MKNVKGWFIISIASILAIAAGVFNIKPAEYLVLAWVALGCFIGLLFWVGVFLPEESREETKKALHKQIPSVKQYTARNVLFFVCLAAAGFPVWAFLYFVLGVFPILVLLQEKE
jgi:membrane protein DedA with SNARE-associated domain